MGICGLPYCTRMGNELLDTVDHYVAGFVLLLGVGLEAVLFVNDFGWTRLTTHLKLVTVGNVDTPYGQDIYPGLFWRFAISVTLPVFSFFLFFYLVAKDVGEAYSGYPGWMQAIGWILLILCLVMIPIVLY